MEDKRIWTVTGYILITGTGVIHYTKYCVNNQGAAMMAETSAGTEKTAASSFAPALGQLDTETGGADAGMAADGATLATPTERRMTGDAGPGDTASGNAASGDAGPGSAGPGDVVYVATPITETAGALSSDHAAPATADAVEETMASDTAGSAGTAERTAVSETASGKDMPVSPLTGARIREYRASRTVDYRKRLEDLDTQVLKMREEEMDSNAYSTKTSAETELRLWKGELNSIYNALMEMLSQEGGAKLASEQQEWFKNRDARAAESSGGNSGSVKGISYVAALVSLTKDRAYESAGHYGEANGVFCEDEDSSQTALPQQAKAWKEQSV